MNDDGLLLLIYASVTSDNGLATMLQHLALRFACQSSVLVYTDPRRPAVEFTRAFGPFSDDAVQQRYHADFATLDPAPAAMTRLRIGQAASTDALFVDAGDDYRPFLDGFYRPIGLAAALGGPLINEDGRIGIVAVHRGPERPAFDDSDTATMQLFMPHLAQMLTLRRAFFEIADKHQALGQAIESSTAGILVFDVDGVLTHANAFAREILDRANGLGLTRTGRLLAAEPAAQRQLQALLTGTDPQTFKVLRVPRTGSDAPYVLRIWTETDGSGPIAEHAGYTVYVCDPERDVGGNVEHLAEALGVTVSSAALVNALLNGDTLDDYARRTGRSQNTVKFHLRSAFAATGTNRQADLLRYCAAVVRDLGL